MKYLWSHDQSYNSTDNRCRNEQLLNGFTYLSYDKTNKQKNAQNHHVVKNRCKCHFHFFSSISVNSKLCN